MMRLQVLKLILIIKGFKINAEKKTKGFDLNRIELMVIK